MEVLKKVFHESFIDPSEKSPFDLISAFVLFGL